MDKGRTNPNVDIKTFFPREHETGSVFPDVNCLSLAKLCKNKMLTENISSITKTENLFFIKTKTLSFT